MTVVEFQSISKTNSGYKIFCTNFKLAKSLNRFLRQYKKDEKNLYSFQADEEAIFTINNEQLKKTLKIFEKHRIKP